MYGTVANIRVKPGHAEQLAAMHQQWWAERAPNVSGALASYIFKLDRDPNEQILVAIFENRESYLANANDPQQDQWFQQLRSHMANDPSWNDGEIVATETT